MGYYERVIMKGLLGALDGYDEYRASAN